MSSSSSADNSIVQEYVLPDFSINRPGRVRQPGEDLTDGMQILRMGNERFSVPELIFRPNDIGKRLPRNSACIRCCLLTQLNSRSRLNGPCCDRGRQCICSHGRDQRHVLGEYWSRWWMHSLSRIRSETVSFRPCHDMRQGNPQRSCHDHSTPM